MRAAVLAIALWAPAAWGAASRVAIVKPAKRDARIEEASVRLGAELSAAGFEVIVLEAKRGVDARSQVERVALDPPPFATIAITRTPEGAAADVWVADRLSKKTVVRRIEQAELESEAPPRALAIRAVELLRASLLEVEADPSAKLPDDVSRWMRSAEPQPAPPPAPHPATPPPAPIGSAVVAPPVPPPTFQRPAALVPGPRTEVAPEAAPETEPYRLFGHATVTVAPGLLVGGLVDVAFVPTLRASAPLPLGFMVRGTLAGTVLENELVGVAGSASVRQDLVLFEVAHAFRDEEAIFVPLISLGVGAYHFGVRGRANAPYESLGEDSWSFSMSAGGGLALRVADPLAIVLETDLLLALPRVSVQIGPEMLGPHGVPLFHPTLGLVASLP
jgi:hypothetical protein